MSKIYFTNKKQFIDAIKKNHRLQEYTQIPITFLIKYHKYEPFLVFLPPVLSDIVFEYLNDIINFLCKIGPMGTELWIDVKNISTIINYEEVNIDIGLEFTYTKNKFKWDTDAIKRLVCDLNRFMLVYYGQKQYLPIKQTVDVITPVTLIDNINQTKYNIIIMKMIIQCIHSIRFNKKSK